MSNLQAFGFVADGESTESALDVTTAAATESVSLTSPTEEEEPSEEEEQQQDEVRPSKPVDLTNFVQLHNSKAYAYKHGGWKRSMDKKSALCPVADCCMVVPTGGNTTNLEVHTKRHHRQMYKEQMEHKAELEKKGLHPKTQSRIKYEPRNLTKRTLTGAIAEFCVLDQQPFYVAQAPSLRHLLRVAANDANLEIPCDDTVSTRVTELATTAEDKLREMLKGTHPALTTDIWTSNSGVPFMAVTAHFIREGSKKLTKTTLSCGEFTGSHTSERLAEKITGVMERFGIAETAVSLTTDTASNIKKCGKKLLDQEWVPCVCHVLQLCALKILDSPGVKSTLAKHNRLTNHLHSSSLASEKLSKIQEAASMTPSKIPTSGKTRWNSAYDQAVAMLENKLCIQQLLVLIERDGKLAFNYSDIDWENTRALVEVLQLLSEATVVLQGDDFITNSMMAMIATNLHTFCVTKACDLHLPEHIREAADSMFGDIEDRFYPPTDCSMIAAVCDPRTKRLTWCDRSEKNTYHNLTVNAMITVMVEEGRGKGKEDAAAGAARDGVDAPACASQGDETARRTDLRRKKPINKSSLLFAKMLAVSAIAAEDEESPEIASKSPEAIHSERKMWAEYELQRYLQADIFTGTESSQDVLDWWYDMRLVYPILYKVACVYLAVPASSATSERVFSAAGNIVTKKRNRLCPESVNNLVFLHGCHGVAWNMGDTNPRVKKVAKGS